MGLEWRHVHVTKGVVQVHQAVVTSGDRISLGLPKQKHGERNVPLDAQNMAVLWTHRDKQDARRERLAARVNEGNSTAIAPEGLNALQADTT